MCAQAYMYMVSCALASLRVEDLGSRILQEMPAGFRDLKKDFWGSQNMVETKNPAGPRYTMASPFPRFSLLRAGRLASTVRIAWEPPGFILRFQQLRSFLGSRKNRDFHVLGSEFGDLFMERQ